MIDLILIIVAIAGFVFVILPQFARSRARSSRISCANNLKQVTLGFIIWAGDNNDLLPMQVSVTNGGAMEFATTGSAYEVFLVVSNELNTPKILLCPHEDNPQRSMAHTFSPTLPSGAPAGLLPFTPTNHLSYFVGLDATQTNAQTILAGDDNLELGKVGPIPGLWLLPSNAPVAWTRKRHINQGYVAFADGSVQGFSTAALRAALANTGIQTNRLAIP